MKGSSILRPFVKVEAEMYVQALRMLQTSLNIRISSLIKIENAAF